MPLFTWGGVSWGWQLLMEISSFPRFNSALSSLRLYCYTVILHLTVVSEVLACFLSCVQSQTFLCKQDAEHVDRNRSARGFSFCLISAWGFVQDSTRRILVAVLTAPSVAPDRLALERPVLPDSGFSLRRKKSFNAWAEHWQQSGLKVICNGWKRDTDFLTKAHSCFRPTVVLFWTY